MPAATAASANQLLNAFSERGLPCVVTTRGIKVVTEDGRESELVQTGGDLYDEIPLWTGMDELTVPAQWNRDGTVTLRQDYPLPMTVLGIAIGISIGRN
ncbi:hypothetical protein SAMN04488021_1209 [Paracoccus aminovorans]|uniref:Uncharacterized protein n=1 Tax=Paracoccus aminovorans TaxID=34004 RepID=A0A1I3B8F7_9RHOB|nr:hypothetical protein [Paracoccus aminovorans]CQR85416.1 hypothetical protein JCM7685_0838 [Paracoccus aminovorans]SFH58346.1 hypothetical protein SAMN04488021_1209 [Paracoccus aminovorans]